MDNLVGYRVDEQTESGWKLGLKVWMYQKHFRSFLATLKPTERIRCEPWFEPGDDALIWNGSVLQVISK